MIFKKLFSHLANSKTIKKKIKKTKPMKMKNMLRITKAVSDANRVRILMALAHQEQLCACHICDLLQISAPSVSRHMNILETAGLVTARKDSRWVYYRLTDETGESEIHPLVHWLGDVLCNDSAIIEDRTALEHTAACGDRNSCKNNKKTTNK